MVFPVAVADDHDGVGVLRVVAFRPGKETAGFGLYAEHVEEIAGNHFAPNLRGVGSLAHGKYIAVAGGDEVEQFEVVAEIAEIQEGSGDGLAVRGHVFDGDDALGLRGTRQGIQQHGAHPTEDGGAGADADAYGQNGYRGEGRISREGAEAVTKVAK